MRETRSYMPLLLVGVLAGCASSSATNPVERIAGPESAIRAAREVGAESQPQAALHLKFAQDQLQQAKKLLAEDEAERAALMLRRAQSDAELALALTREASARSTAQQTIQEVQKLQQQQQGPGGR